MVWKNGTDVSCVTSGVVEVLCNFPVPGLDWSEDSADDDEEEDEEEAETFVPFQSSWRPRNGSVS